MITVIGNLKGGTGKSTVAFNLALWMLSKGREVQLCDLDPQATLRDAAEVRLEEGYDPVLEILDAIPAKPKTEILVDIGMSDTPHMREALARAHRVLIPVAPSQADVWSTQRFLTIIDEAVGRRKKPELLTFINRADTHPAARESKEAASALRQLGRLKVLRPSLGQRMAFRRSFSEGMAVFELDRRGKAASELDSLARSVFGRGGKK